MIWTLADRFHPAAQAMADRHYSRQSVGSPQVAPPGRCLVLLAPGALWITSWPQFAMHRWAGAWVCTLFRRENDELPVASELVRQAVAASRWRWPETPELGMVTFVDAGAVRRKRDPGRCFRRAGFVPVGRSVRRGHLVLQLPPTGMPEPAAPLGAPAHLGVVA